MPLRTSILSLALIPALLAVACGGATDADRLSADDLENATYLAEGPDAGEATLDGGEYRYPVAEGSSAEAVIRLDQWALGDLDGDGAEDAAAITSERPGGSGVFSYVHALRNESGEPRDLGFAFLGDRVRVESVAIRDGVIVVALFDRPETAPYVEEPSIAVIRRFRLDGGALVEQPAPTLNENGGDDATDADRLSADDLENATYLAEGPDVGEATLDGGEFRYPVAEGSSSEAVIRLDQWSAGDLDGDGAEDAAAITSERPGGSGVFSYVHALRNESGEPRDLGFAFLGDRVRVESVAIRDGVIVVALFDRPETAPYAEEPSIAVIRRFRLDGGALVEQPAPALNENGGDDATDADRLSANDLENATYLAEGPDAGEATLDGGEFRYPVAEGSSAEAVIRLDQWSTGDLDGDGAEDAAAITREWPGGSGVFSYVHALRNESGEPRDLAFALLGDRVRVESVAIHDGVIVVALFDRPETAPYAEEPSIAVIRRFRLDGGALVELAAP